jgi:transcriptional regulator with XRE-family HTH domain
MSRADGPPFSPEPPSEDRQAWHIQLRSYLFVTVSARSCPAWASDGSRPLNGRYPPARDATVNPTETFGDVLKHWRGRAGLSLHQLEEAVGMSATNLSRIERGLVGPPTAEWLDKLAAALGAPRSRLYRAAGRIPPSEEDDRADVIEAILTDPDFTQEEKSFLVNAVKFVRQHRGIRRQGSR